MRTWLEASALPYVLAAVRCTQPLLPPGAGGPLMSAEALAAQVLPESWLRPNAGDGAKRKPWYAWSCLPLATPGAPDGWGAGCWSAATLPPGNWRSTPAPPRPVLPLVALVRVAGCRWRLEEAFQVAKGLCGLDQRQVRRWRSWYCWATLALLAHAFLVVAALTDRARHRHHPDWSG